MNGVTLVHIVTEDSLIFDELDLSLLVLLLGVSSLVIGKVSNAAQGGKGNIIHWGNREVDA